MDSNSAILLQIIATKGYQLILILVKLIKGKKIKIPKIQTNNKLFII